MTDNALYIVTCPRLKGDILQIKKGHRAKKKNGQKLIVRYDLFQKQLQAKLPFYKINPKFGVIKQLFKKKDTVCQERTI